jgi:hypothetical protein
MKLLYEFTPKLGLTKEQKKILDSAIKEMGITASWSDQFWGQEGQTPG